MVAFGSNDNAGAIWIAVNALPNREYVAATHLRNQGYAPYVPTMRKQIRHARQVRDVLRPLFPGYLFVRLPRGNTRWRPILSTVGVRTVVCAGEAPSVVPETFIEDLKLREKDGVIVRSIASRQIGETVLVAHGAFDGIVGKIVELSENDRLIVLMDFLNRPVRVTIPGDLLSVA
jgi:transcriptional antiterminator RfaH